ncbi:AraC family transcriptional regulator [Thalassotalea sp. G2M2-11]|uniref:AraC family transcriptional regulator n=1 Tax=Thalassotalea sp. G2M2-11 TaxID=2787627 RepID=UPI0019D11DAE|nr:AraC family transcriptional regulator [Thalassotalea sp. G2M2-11]
MLWSAEVQLKQNIALHAHNLHEFVICLDGTIKVSVGEVEVNCLKGDSFFLPANLPHKISLNRQHGEPIDANLFFVCIDQKTFSELLTPNNTEILVPLTEFKELKVARCQSNAETGVDSLTKLTEQLQTVTCLNDRYSASIQESIFVQMLLTHRSRLEISDIHQDGKQLRLVNAMQWMKRNLSENITIDHIAEQANMSRSHLSRQFKKYYCYSVIDYLLKIRCEAAAKKLASSSDDVSVIAFDTGFSNLSHFHRHFKRIFGLPPNAYRKMLLDQGVKH